MSVAVPVWMDDLDGEACVICEAAFTVLRRRHHCRRCGTLVCGDCSKGRAWLPLLGFGRPGVPRREPQTTRPRRASSTGDEERPFNSGSFFSSSPAFDSRSGGFVDLEEEEAESNNEDSGVRVCDPCLKQVRGGAAPRRSSSLQTSVETFFSRVTTWWARSLESDENSGYGEDDAHHSVNENAIPRSSRGVTASALATECSRGLQYLLSTFMEASAEPCLIGSRLNLPVRCTHMVSSRQGCTYAMAISTISRRARRDGSRRLSEPDWDNLLESFSHGPLVPQLAGDDPSSAGLGQITSSDSDEDSFLTAASDSDLDYRQSMDSSGALSFRKTSDDDSKHSVALVEWIQLLHRPLGTALRNRMFGGVSRPVRLLAWAHLSGADCRMRRNPGVFHHLASSLPIAAGLMNEPDSIRVGPQAEAVVDHLVERADAIIAQDIPRTFPDSDIFGRSRAKKLLEKVLRVYARYDPHLGYEQGMNYICAVLLVGCGFDEEITFWTFVQLMEQYGLNRLYSVRRVNAEPTLSGKRVVLRESADMPGYLNDLITRLEQVVASDMPLLRKHLQKAGVDISIAAAQWFRTLMTHFLSLQVSLRVMDAFFAEGFDALMFVAVSLLQESEPQLLRMKSSVEILQFLVQSSHTAEHTDLERAVLRILDLQGVESLL